MLMKASVLLSVTTVGFETIFVLLRVLRADRITLKSDDEKTAEATRLVPPVLVNDEKLFRALLAALLSRLEPLVEFVVVVLPLEPEVVLIVDPVGVVVVVVVLLLLFGTCVGTVCCVTRPVMGSVVVVVTGVSVEPVVEVEVTVPDVPLWPVVLEELFVPALVPFDEDVLVLFEVEEEEAPSVPKPSPKDCPRLRVNVWLMPRTPKVMP